MAADEMIGSKHRPNTELTARGIASIGSSLLAACPQSGQLRGRKSDLLVPKQTLVLTVLVDLAAAIAVGVSVGVALRLSRRKSADSDWSLPDR